MPRTSPPLPRCAFRVAIAGHRPDRFPDQAVSPIDGHLRRALQVIGDEVIRVAGDPGNGYAPEPPQLTLLSGLAAGADQLAAEAALGSTLWQLHAVLPFAREAYEDDFRHDPHAHQQFTRQMKLAHAVTVLDGRATSPVDGKRAFDAYVPLGRLLVDQCDLLLAVWDEDPARGVGGTASVVQQAREGDVPVLRFNPRNPASVVLEVRPAFETTGDWTATLKQQVALLLEPPAPALAKHGDEIDLRREYFEEQLPLRRRSTLFDLIGAALHRRSGEPGWFGRVTSTLKRMIKGDAVPDPASEAAASWAGAWSSMPGPVQQGALARFAAHQGWADTLATHYAAAFRASYSRVFALAWLAVLAAFAGTVAEVWAERGGESGVAAAIHDACLGAEALILLVVFANVYWGRRGRLHERWLDYRALAERLRHLAVIWPLGRTTAAVRLPAIVLNGDPRTSWIGWYLRSVAREAGLMAGELDPPHVAASRALLRDGELERQRRFHAAASDRGRAIVHPLERGAEILFLVALLVALANLLHWPEKVLHLVTANPAVPVAILGAIGVGLPALASAIHGFLGTSDLESIAIRSAGVEPRLRELIWRLDHLAQVDSSSVGEIGIEAARIMEGELGSWRAVTAARKLTPV